MVFFRSTANFQLSIVLRYDWRRFGSIAKTPNHANQSLNNDKFSKPCSQMSMRSRNSNILKTKYLKEKKNHNFKSMMITL